MFAHTREANGWLRVSPAAAVPHVPVVDHTARLWGLSDADIHGNRLAAKATMPAADSHEASNLVLIKADALRQPGGHAGLGEDDAAEAGAKGGSASPAAEKPSAAASP